jgi:hypothetical protein
MVVNRIGAVSLAKIAGILYALVGLLFGAVLSLLAMAGALGGAQDAGQGALFGAIFGAGAIVLFPVFYGVLGFVTVLIMALLYNGIASIVGGVEIDVQ